MPYEAIIFDLDGTLIDSVADLAAATNRALATHSFPVHATEEYRNFIGDGARKLIVRALPVRARENEDAVADCLADFSRYYGEAWDVQTRLYPGIPETLTHLQKLGLKLAVLSNKPDEFTQSIALRFLADWRFDVVMGATSRFPHKPDPASALHIASCLGLSPSDFLYVGDMPVDIQTAKNAGMRAISASWGLRSRQQLLEAGAETIIDAPSELIAIASAKS